MEAKTEARRETTEPFSREDDGPVLIWVQMD